ncbi:hypothetical protein CP979_26450 [Streptomyces filamentosus]|nr:hypothetical protein CP979_35865 [Streptomyces filamentosus]KAA6220040.1 hypothetical protein CP979_26450 [Streptomyces filamentosus]
MKAAEGVILAALVGSDASASGIAAALEAAGLLQSPESAAEVAALRARVAELEAAAICSSVARLHGSKCVLPVRHRGDHQDETKRHYWSDDYAVPQQRQAEGDPIAYGPTGIPCGCGKPAHSNLVPCRQAEDPHDGPNHHDYALGRDLPVIPHQTTGRCPVCGGTFEDCTCGGGR